MPEQPAPPPPPLERAAAELLGRVLWRLLSAAAPPPEPPAAEALSPAGLAALLSVSVSMVHQLNADGFLPEPVNLGDGRCPRYSATEVRAWLLAGAPARARWRVLRDAALRTFRSAG